MLVLPQSLPPPAEATQLSRGLKVLHLITVLSHHAQQQRKSVWTYTCARIYCRRNSVFNLFVFFCSCLVHGLLLFFSCNYQRQTYKRTSDYNAQQLRDSHGQSVCLKRLFSKISPKKKKFYQTNKKNKFEN